MKKTILIAVDSSENAMKAVDYVGAMVRCHGEVEISVINVIIEPLADIIPDAEERRVYVEQKRLQGLSLLEEAGHRLRSHGIPEEQIILRIHVCSKPTGVADLILSEQAKEKYGTIVVGRRGVSKKEEFLFGSVSSKVVHEAKGCAVWVIE